MNFFVQRKVVLNFGVELRIADFNDENLSDAFTGADTMILVSMPFVGPKRRAAQKTALESYVTLAVALILQMAASLDYAVFLSSAYEKHRKKAPNDAIAMIWAMKESFKSILSSVLTTIFGFFALTMMEFKIEPDMGISLVKGVVLSLVSCMTFLPAEILLLNKVIDKTRHRKFMPGFKAAGKVAVRLRIPTFILVLLVSGICYIGQANNRFTYGSGDAAGNTEEAAARMFWAEQRHGSSGAGYGQNKREIIKQADRRNFGRNQTEFLRRELCEDYHLLRSAG